MSFVVEIPAKDLLALEILFEHGGIIYGGYLRDLYAGIEPGDIDVMVPSETLQHFYEELGKIGYIYRPTRDDDGVEHIKFFKGDNTPLDISEGNEPSRLDYDVNTLIYDGIELTSWVGLNAKDIIENIKKRQMLELSPDIEPSRIRHMLEKGFNPIDSKMIYEALYNEK